MVLSSSYDTYMQQYIIAQCYVTIGMRYHSNIFSAKGGKPFIAIAYEEKMIGFMQEHHLDEYMVKLQDLGLERLMQSFEKMVANYDSYQKQLQENRELFRAKAQETEKAIIEFLHKYTNQHEKRDLYRYGRSRKGYGTAFRGSETIQRYSVPFKAHHRASFGASEYGERALRL